jgi:hypothetical protein
MCKASGLMIEGMNGVPVTANRAHNDAPQWAVAWESWSR